MAARDHLLARAQAAPNPLVRRYLEIAADKRSLLILAADRPTTAGIAELVEQVGEHLVALKTHVDLVEDHDPETWAAVCEQARAAGVLVFEDRKFADIGKISRDQMRGRYDIARWADLVTAHLISGPDIVDGLHAGWAGVDRVGGVVLLAQMSSRGNLLEPAYTEQVVRAGRARPAEVMGYIGNGSSAAAVADLRARLTDEQLLLTPGINLATGDGDVGQRYGDPTEAVAAGSDGIIVGSGIHKAADPAEAAAAYAAAAWAGLNERLA